MIYSAEVDAARRFSGRFVKLIKRHAGWPLPRERTANLRNFITQDKQTRMTDKTPKKALYPTISRIDCLGAYGGDSWIAARFGWDARAELMGFGPAANSLSMSPFRTPRDSHNSYTDT